MKSIIYDGARIHANYIQINEELNLRSICKCTYLYNKCLKTFHNVTLIGLFDKEMT